MKQAASRPQGIRSHKIELLRVTCWDNLKSKFVYLVGTILSPHTEKEYDENVYTFCAFFSDIDILLCYKRGGLRGPKVQMSVVSSEF
jgi:hypothetical protein